MSYDAVQMVLDGAKSMYRSVTFITTYQCTAACRECCFESSPQLKSDRLSFELMKSVIDEAAETLPNLRLAVFSGGECFMLKDELFRTIAYSTRKGLLSRCVTNGYWGKTPAGANRIVRKLKDAGISEINISTGLDHQEWVPLESVFNCASALLKAGIFTLVTVEKDTDKSNCWNDAHAKFKPLVQAHPKMLKLISNSWMPFHQNSVSRGGKDGQRGYRTDVGCHQLFGNLVITPYKMVSACCGLTYEHIPEMSMGRVSDKSLGQFVDDMAEDFLKIWIHVDGPREIVRKLTGKTTNELMDTTVHICQACAILHQNAEFREALQRRFHEFVPDVLGRFFLRKALSSPALAISRMAPSELLSTAAA